MVNLNRKDEIVSPLPSTSGMKTDQSQTRGWKISGRTMILIIVVATVLGIVLTAASVYLNGAPTGTTSMTGTLYVNSGSQLNAPSNYTATYNATLSSNNGIGTLNLTLITGTSDALSVHDYNVTGLVANPYNLTMSLNGQNITLPWVSNSTIWKQNNESYIASWGPAAPASEVKGVIAPQDFPGLHSGYFLTLILTIPAQPQDDIPFMIATYTEA
jgi:hypothetical protein